MKTIKTQLKEALIGLGYPEERVVVEYPTVSEHGDYSTNLAMAMAKEKQMNPMDLAREIIEQLRTDDFISQTFDNIDVLKPGFINFKLNEQTYHGVIDQVISSPESYGRLDVGRDKHVLVEYSSPNVAKNMHVGHIRSTFIGDSLARIFDFLGYSIITDNHIGDWGTQYGIMLYQYKKKYGTDVRTDVTLDELEEMYVAFKKQEKEDPELIEEAKKELKDLQYGDTTNLALWENLYTISLNEFKKVYQILGVREFDLWNGESFYNEMLEGVVADALEKGVAQKSQGAVIIDLEAYNLPPLLIQKSDGAYLYATSDLATIIYREKEYHTDQILYVVGQEQNTYFQQILKAAELLGLGDTTKLTHVSFGFYAGKDGKKFSTRKGGAVHLSDLIDEAISRARKIVEEKNPDLPDAEKNTIAEVVGIGALKYADLSQNRLSNIVFDWDKLLSFNAGSSVYLQYTYVRIQSILKKQLRQAVHAMRRI